jgi:hypothetical protein
MELPVAVAFLSEDVLQEHQLGLQAVFITESSGPVYQWIMSLAVVSVTKI